MAEIFGGLNTIVEDDFDYSIKVKKTVSKTGQLKDKSQSNPLITTNQSPSLSYKGGMIN
jgi:uncharacterized protein YecE (DUF72 family)